MPEPRCVAMIPARAGSKRIPGKNHRELCGIPLVAYTIKAAIDSAIFSRIVVSTDSPEVADIAQDYNMEVIRRPVELASATSPDIEWVTHALQSLDHTYDCFAILRPTSPFRTGATIKRAWMEWCAEKPSAFDSLRAVERCTQHPAKMWKLSGNRLIPLLDQPSPVPWHSQQYASLPEVYAQNASLEIAWTKTVTQGKSIAGEKIMAFLTEGIDGFDINTELDWILAEHLMKNR